MNTKNENRIDALLIILDNLGSKLLSLSDKNMGVAISCIKLYNRLKCFICFITYDKDDITLGCDIYWIKKTLR